MPSGPALIKSASHVSDMKEGGEEDDEEQKINRRQSQKLSRSQSIVDNAE